MPQVKTNKIVGDSAGVCFQVVAASTSFHIGRSFAVSRADSVIALDKILMGEPLTVSAR